MTATALRRAVLRFAPDGAVVSAKSAAAAPETPTEHKASPIADTRTDDETGEFWALVAVTGLLDEVRDIIEPGAFAKTLRKRTPKGVHHHEWSVWTARADEATELQPGDERLPKELRDGTPWPANAGGLLIHGKCNLGTQAGRDAFSNIKFFGDQLEWCVDEETEILTARGWLRYDELTTNDVAYVLDTDTLTSRFEPVLAVNVWEPRERALRLIETGGFSSLTTADHRWPVLHTNGKHGAVRWTTTADLRRNDRIFRCAPHVEAPTEAKWPDALVEIVAWVWTEGSRQRGALSIGQSLLRNPQHVASIRRALTALAPGGGWSEHHRRDGMMQFSLSQALTASIEPFLGPDKEPRPEFLLDLTPSQLRLLVERCLDGDGHVSPTGQRTWYQVAQAGIDAFQMACALAGIPTNGRIDKDYGTRHGRTPQAVSLLRHGLAAPLASIATKSYGYKPGAARTPATDEVVAHHGIVWCPTTPSGTWLARRCGSVYFTGNSIGYAVPAGKSWRDRQGNRHIVELDCFEFSTVLFGAHPQTRTIAYKSLNNWEATVGDTATGTLVERTPAVVVDDPDALHVAAVAEIDWDDVEALGGAVEEVEQAGTELTETTPPDVAVKALGDAWSATELKALADRLIAGGATDLAVFEVKAGGVDRNRGNAEQLRRWYVRGGGAAKIAWGTEGDFARCVALAGKHMDPKRAKGYCNLRHKEATGEFAGQGAHGKKDAAPERLETKDAETKGMYVPDLPNSLEKRVQAVASAVREKYRTREVSGVPTRTWTYASVVNTFATEVLVRVTTNSGDDHSERYETVAYTVDADGSVTLGEATEVNVQLTVSTKSLVGSRIEVGEDGEVKILAAEVDGKAYPHLAGSVEERQDALRTAVREAMRGKKDEDTGRYEFDAYVIATFGDHVIVRRMDTATWDNETHWRVDYTIGEDGTVELGAPRQVELEVTVGVVDTDATAGGTYSETGAVMSKALEAVAEIKAGRVLSSANEAHLIAATQHLVEVLHKCGIEVVIEKPQINQPSSTAGGHNPIKEPAAPDTTSPGTKAGEQGDETKATAPDEGKAAPAGTEEPAVPEGMVAIPEHEILEALATFA